MLVARPSKRTGADRVAADTRFDILAGERLLGRLSCDRSSLGATLSLDDQAYVVERTGGTAKPARNRYELKAADGAVLASAEQTGEVFQIARGEERFRFAKGRSKLLFDLWAEGQPAPLGSVGQRKFWTLRMHMDLPDTLGAPTQVFLLSLLLGLIAQRAGNLATGV